jgi:hypothetical protein
LWTMAGRSGSLAAVCHASSFMCVCWERDRERESSWSYYMRIHRCDNLLIPSSSSLRNNWPGVVPHQTLRIVEMYAGQNGMSGRPSLMVVNVCNFWPVTSSLLRVCLCHCRLKNYYRLLKSHPPPSRLPRPCLSFSASYCCTRRAAHMTAVQPGPAIKSGCDSHGKARWLWRICSSHEQPGAAAQPQAAREGKQTLQSPKKNLFSERV